MLRGERTRKSKKPSHRDRWNDRGFSDHARLTGPSARAISSLSLSVTLILILFITDDSNIQPAYCVIQLDGEGRWKYGRPNLSSASTITLSASRSHLSNSTNVTYHVARSLIRNLDARYIALASDGVPRMCTWKHTRPLRARAPP